MTAMTDAVPRVDHAIARVERQFGIIFEGVRASLREHALSIHPELQPFGYKVVGLLVSRGPLHASQMAELLATDKSLLSRTAKQLETLDLVSRQPDPNDGRATFLVATDEAVRRFDAVRKRDQQVLYQRMRGWDADEVLQLAALLEKLNDTFSG